MMGECHGETWRREQVIVSFSASGGGDKTRDAAKHEESNTK